MMRAVLWLLVAAFGLVLAGSAGAEAPVRVRIRPVQDGVEAAFTLPSPTASVAFGEIADAVRTDTWRVATAGVALKNGVVARTDGAPLRNFVVKITADTAPRDRTYPGLTRVGQGWQLYGPYLIVRDRETRADLDLPPGWTTAPHGAARIDPRGYIYLGPRADVADGAAVVVAPPEVSAALRSTILSAAQQAASAYQRRLGMALDAKPTVTIALVPAFKGGFQGDTTDGSVVSLRFFGDGWDTPNPKAASRAVRFVYHEFFHLWNSRLAHSRDGAREAWLHEGMAEYAALVTSTADGSTDEATARDELSGHLSGCAKRLDKGLALAPPQGGSAVYDCGVLAQWAADLDAHGRGQDVFDVWKILFAPGTDKGREYDAARFAAVAESGRPDDPLALLMASPDKPDWDAFAAGMTARGAKITHGRRAAEDRIALIWRLERQVCGDGPIGFYTLPDALKLATGSACGPLHGDPVIDTVAGINVMTQASLAFDRAASICAAGGEVALTRGAAPVAAIVCKTPLQPVLAWSVDQRG